MNKPLVVLARVVAACLSIFAGHVQSATVTVTSNADSGNGTLRAAIANGNANDTIVFALPPGSVITLASTLTLSKNVTIDGSGTTGLAISGNNAVEVLVVNAGVSATIAGLSLVKGHADFPAASGGIHNLGTLTVSSATLAENYSDGNGGAIYSEGSLTLTNSTLSTNGAGTNGGAIYLAGGSATITNNTFAGNFASYGGGIYLGGNVSAITVMNNLFHANTAGQYGGSIGDAANQISANHNLYWNNADSTGAQGITCNNCLGNTNAVNADPLLGALQDNGGPTRTYKPAIGSPAINAGNSAACPATDQRGAARPQGAACDIGAVQAPWCYVKATAAGSNDGTSWANAFTDLQAALSAVGCRQIWVAKGTYRPTATTDRSISFNVPRGVFLYGGLAGTEDNINSRSAANQAILSGDIGTAGDNGDNSYHVVRLDGTTAAGPITMATNAIDGFTITSGNASGAVSADVRGGGIYCDGSGGVDHECSPRLNNLTIIDNNAVEWAGGAFFNGESGKSNPLLTNSTFTGNTAAYGGGLMCFGQSGGLSSPVIGNVTFSGNMAGQWGAALYNAAYASGTSSPTLINVTFTGNSAGSSGGAMVSDGRNGGYSHPNLSNVIAWGDQAVLEPEMYAASDGSPGSSVFTTVANSVVLGGCPLGAGSCSNVLSTDPQLGTFGNHGGLTPTIVPGMTGSAYDTGDDAACTSQPINGFDQRDLARPISVHCDIGAVESNDHIFGNGFDGS